MHALSVSLLRAKQLPVITNGLGASPHAGSTCTIGVVTVRPLNRLPARLYFKLKPDPNNTFFFIFTCTTQYPWVLANLNLSQAMAPSKKKRIHTVFRDSSAHRSASTSKPRFVGDGQLVELGSICELVMGQSPSSDTYNADGEGLPFYQGNADFGEKNPIPHVWCTEPKKVAEKGDILISVRAPIGAINIASEQCCIGRGVAAIRPRLDFISADFLMHQLLASQKKLELMGTGSTFKAVGKKALNGFAISIYPKGDQDIIADQLDCIIQQIKATETQVVKLDQLVKSRFVEMFGELDTNPKGFQLTCFDDLGTWTSGGTPSRKNPSYFTGEIDWYSAGELNSLHLGRSKERISLRAIEESSAKLVPPGSLFVGMYDTAALKMGITTKESSSNQACANLVPNGIVDLVWLYFAIDQLKPSLLAKRSGCRQKNLSLKKIKSFMVPLPDLDSQQGFSRFVAQVDKSRFVRDHEMNFR